MKKILLSLLLFSSLFSLALFAKKTTIIVTIEPQKYFLQKIAKDKIIIKTIFKESNFEVKFKQLTLKKLAESDIYMTMGLDVETQFLDALKNINTKLEIFDMSQDVKKIKDNEKVNPYVWMDPLKVRDIAKTIFLKLSQNDPANRRFYENNYNEFLLELDKLYLKIKKLYRNVAFSIYALDDYWDYFARRFDFPLYKVEKRVLDAKELSTFIKKSQKRDVRIILSDYKTTRTVTKSISTNANARVVQSEIFKYDWIGNLYLIAEKIKKKSVSRLK